MTDEYVDEQRYTIVKRSLVAICGVLIVYSVIYTTICVIHAKSFEGGYDNDANIVLTKIAFIIACVISIGLLVMGICGAIFEKCGLTLAFAITAGIACALNILGLVMTPHLTDWWTTWIVIMQVVLIVLVFIAVVLASLFTYWTKQRRNSGEIKVPKNVEKQEH